MAEYISLRYEVNIMYGKLNAFDKLLAGDTSFDEFKRKLGEAKQGLSLE